MGKYIGMAGSLASLLALFITDINNHTWIHYISFIVGLVGFFLAVVFEYREYKANKEKKNREKPLEFDRRGNIDYMHDIIKREGKTIVFAGNLSWVDNDEIKNAMLNKGSDLYLCVKTTAPYIDEFKKAKVNVFTYEDDKFSPNTHFTIMRSGTINEKIAITSINDGHDKEKRIVYEIPKNNNSFKDSWLVHAADDIFKLTQIISEQKEQSCTSNQ